MSEDFLPAFLKRKAPPTVDPMTGNKGAETAGLILKHLLNHPGQHSVDELYDAVKDSITLTKDFNLKHLTRVVRTLLSQELITEYNGGVIASSQYWYNTVIKYQEYLNDLRINIQRKSQQLEMTHG